MPYPTRANSVATTYGHDDIGRLISATVSGQAQTFTWDEKGDGYS